jgi:cob(I)alamin adenosyltransferase
MRAAGQGLKVAFVQFLKGNSCCGEHLFLERFPAFKIFQQAESSTFEQSNEERRKVASQALAFAQTLVSQDYSVIVLDEAITAVDRQLLDSAELVALLKDKPASLEMILTGRGATAELMDIADYVTEMCEIKHPFSQGVKARLGIEF